MSELKSGDIRMGTDRNPYIVVYNYYKGIYERVWLKTSNGLETSGIQPNSEDTLLANIQEIFNKIGERAKMGVYD